MKTKLTTLTLIALFAATGSSVALAHQDSSESSLFHNLRHVTQAKGAEGRPAVLEVLPLADYGEGTSLLTITQFVPGGGPDAVSGNWHSENEEGTSTFHAAHAGQRY